MKLDDLNLFRIIVENGTFTAASRKTQIPVATLTRHIQALEDSLNIRLLNRHARKLTLTDAGTKFYNETSPLIHLAIETAENIVDEFKGAAGKIRIGASTNLANNFLEELLFEFLKEHSSISIDLQVCNDNEQMDVMDWDVMFTTGSMKDSSLIARKIFTSKLIMVASSEYLANSTPVKDPVDLHQHRLLKQKNRIRWSIENKDLNQHVVIAGKPSFVSSEMNAIKSACLSNAGIALLPDKFCNESLMTKNLIQVLPEWSENDIESYIVYNHRENQPQKLKLFIEFVIKYTQNRKLD